MEHYHEITARKSPHRGQILTYQNQPLISSREESDVIDSQHYRRSSLSTSPFRTSPYSDSQVPIKKTSCPSGPMISQDKHVRSRPKSLAFDQEMIDSHNDTWLNEYTDSSIASNVSQSEVRIRKYKSVISLSSDNTSTVQTVPQHTMSKSVHQSPVKPARTPKIIDVSPQYFSTSKQMKSKEQGGSRVKELLFRRLSRSSDTKNIENEQKDPVTYGTRRSKSSSSPSTKSNMRFLIKKSNNDEDEEYLLKLSNDNTNVGVSNSSISTTMTTPEYHPMSYSSSEDSS